MKQGVYLWLVLICCFLNFQSVGQYNNKVGFNSDNDAYLLFAGDEYYTNGLEIYYTRVLTSDSETPGVIEFSANQHLFNSRRILTAELEDLDRPYAGHLFGTLSYGRILSETSFAMAKAQLGIIGPSAFGQEAQDLVHRIFNFEEAKGWDSQVGDEVGAHISGYYFLELNQTELKDNLNFETQASLGNQFQNGFVGILYRSGNLQPINKTAWLNLKTDRRLESFFKLNPRLHYVHYNATIQGGKSNDDDPLTFDVVPVVGSLDVGYFRAVNHWEMEFSVELLTKEVDNDDASFHQYATIGFGYLF